MTFHERIRAIINEVWPPEAQEEIFRKFEKILLEMEEYWYKEGSRISLEDGRIAGYLAGRNSLKALILKILE